MLHPNQDWIFNVFLLWTENTTAAVGKAQQRLHSLKTLRRNNSHSHQHSPNFLNWFIFITDFYKLIVLLFWLDGWSCFKESLWLRVKRQKKVSEIISRTTWIFLWHLFIFLFAIKVLDRDSESVDAQNQMTRNWTEPQITWLEHL